MSDSDSFRVKAQNVLLKKEAKLFPLEGNNPNQAGFITQLH